MTLDIWPRRESIHWIWGMGMLWLSGRSLFRYYRKLQLDRCEPNKWLFKGRKSSYNGDRWYNRFINWGRYRESEYLHQQQIRFNAHGGAVHVAWRRPGFMLYRLKVEASSRFDETSSDQLMIPKILWAIQEKPRSSNILFSSLFPFNHITSWCANNHPKYPIKKPKNPPRLRVTICCRNS